MVVAPKVAESTVEEATLAWLTEIGWQLAYGPDVEPEKLGAERDDFAEVVLTRRLTAALERINPELPSSSLRSDRPHCAASRAPFPCRVQPSLSQAPGRRHRRRVHARRRLDRRRPGVAHRLRQPRGQRLPGGQPVHRQRRQDHPPPRRRALRQRPAARRDRAQEPGDENATTKTAFHQLQTYKQDIPALFTHNELLVASDGPEARHRHPDRRLGTLHALAHGRRRRASPRRARRSWRR